MKCFMSNKECEYFSYHRNSKEDEVFVISPFGFPYDEIYDLGLKGAIKNFGKKISRADFALQLGYVMCQRVCRKIIEANIIIADISEPNPNVYYELGLSYSLRKNIVFISNKKSQNKFLFNLDNKKAYYIKYGSLDDFLKKEKNKIKKNAIYNALETPFHIDQDRFEKLTDRTQYYKNNRIIIFDNEKAPLPAWLTLNRTKC